MIKESDFSAYSTSRLLAIVSLGFLAFSSEVNARWAFFYNGCYRLSSSVRIIYGGEKLFKF